MGEQEQVAHFFERQGRLNCGKGGAVATMRTEETAQQHRPAASGTRIGAAANVQALVELSMPLPCCMSAALAAAGASISFF